MPRLKDTRKSRQSNVFAASRTTCSRGAAGGPVLQLIPYMRDLKKRRAFRLPPRPPHPELDPPPERCDVEPIRGDGVDETRVSAPELSDFSCASRVLRPVGVSEIAKLAEAVGFELGAKSRAAAPVLIEDEGEFAKMAKVCAEDEASRNDGRLRRQLLRDLAAVSNVAPSFRLLALEPHRRRSRSATSTCAIVSRGCTASTGFRR